ncbi:nessy [Carabus blaptoides fortunei]
MAGDVVSRGLILNLAEFVGTTEPALRLLISIFFGYPLALLHRNFLYGRKGLIQHLYFLISGIAIGYFNYGFEILHPLSAILYTYLITTLLKGSLLSLQISFVINFSHLLLGYYFTGTDDYDIKWTMPFCVLVLRLIGYSFNVYDGTLPDEKLSNDNKQVCLREPPSFLKYCGFMCFPASFLVGPQFPYKRYENFVNGVYRESDDENVLPDCIGPALRRLGQGILYLALFQGGSTYFTESYLMSESYEELSFLWRMVYLSFWARFQLYKYISCWLITEGALIMFSLSHNGKDNSGITQWNGCENVKLWLFENATEFNHYILSFNINTNHWVAQYIYKRLRFLGNRYLSQLFALAFLAVWHGFHSGYYICFFNEFIVMFFEKDLRTMIEKHEKVVNFFRTPGISHALYFVLRCYTFLFMGWCLAPFVLLKFPKYYQIYSSVYFIGFIFFLPWPIVYKPIVKLALGKSKTNIE